MIAEENFEALEHNHDEETKEEDAHQHHTSYKNHIHSSDEDATLPATLDEVESPLTGAVLSGQVKGHEGHSHEQGFVHDEEHCDECQLSA